MEPKQKRQKQATLRHVWSRAPTKLQHTPGDHNVSTQPPHSLQGLLHASEYNKENVDPEKECQAQIMGSSNTPEALPAIDPLCEVQTTETLVLKDMFPSRSSLLQYINGMLCSDGSVGIRKKGPQRFEAIVRICQSNRAFLTAINKGFDNTGYISLHSASGTRHNVQEGRYSDGELRQTLTFYGEAADKVAGELAPFSVTKTQHFKLLLEMLNQPNSQKSKYLDQISTLNSNPQDCILEAKNIKPEWLAGMFDGDGGITVPHNDKAGRSRSRLELNITQEKCPALLKAIQALYPGTIVTNPHRLKWVAADIIPDVYKALGSHFILKKQKLNTLLTHLFKVDITKDPIVGGRRGAFTCPCPTKGWTADHWRDYLHEPLSAWSRLIGNTHVPSNTMAATLSPLKWS